MKITAIIGSQRKNGNTTGAAQALFAHLQTLAKNTGTPLETEMISLGDHQIEPCRGCRIFFNAGEEKCTYYHDAVAHIKEKIKASDVIILASPVYVDAVSGTMKNFIDRLAYTCHRPEFSKISVFALATTGSSPTNNTLRTLQGAALSMGFHLIGKLGLTCGAFLTRESIEFRYAKKLERSAKKIYQAVIKEKYRRPSLIALIMFRIQQYNWSRQDPTSLDHRYWENNGWTDTKTAFFIPIKVDPFRKAFTRWVGGLIGWMFSS